MKDKTIISKAQPVSESAHEDLRGARVQNDLDLDKFMGRGQSKRGIDAQDYVRSLRENDRI